MKLIENIIGNLIVFTVLFPLQFIMFSIIRVALAIRLVTKGRSDVSSTIYLVNRELASLKADCEERCKDNECSAGLRVLAKNMLYEIEYLNSIA